MREVDVSDQPQTYIYTTDRGVFGSTHTPTQVAAQLAELEDREFYDIGNGTLIRVGAISYLMPA